LVVVPTFVRKSSEIEIARTALRTLREGQPGVDVLVVDDHSPDERHRRKLARLAERYGCDFWPQPVNGGFARAVNVGLRQALATGRDAVLANADLEFTEPLWLNHMVAARGVDDPGRPAALVGALLTYPNGTVQHAGDAFSRLTRTFYHRGQGGSPATLELLQRRRSLVTAALCLIRHETLEAVGLYDEEFGLGLEDVDYGLRVLRSGRESVYDPAVRAVHHESAFRGRPSPKIRDLHRRSAVRMREKWAGHDLADLIAPL
jgi:GT2 family glycosyltransferase